jgi:tellurite resistance protein TehA-like permease
MKVYLITTGTVFGLIVLAHIWRVLEEGSRLVTDPGFVLLTLAAAALSFWAWRLLGHSARS